MGDNKLFSFYSALKAAQAKLKQAATAQQQEVSMNLLHNLIIETSKDLRI